MSYGDIRSLPLPYRRWFLRRLSDEFKSQAESRKKSSTESGDSRSRDVPVDEMMDMIHQKTFKKFE